MRLPPQMKTSLAVGRPAELRNRPPVEKQKDSFKKVIFTTLKQTPADEGAPFSFRLRPGDLFRPIYM